MTGPDWAVVGVVVAVAAVQWRYAAMMFGSLAARVDALAADVRDIDRRLARLEGVVSVSLGGAGTTRQGSARLGAAGRGMARRG